MGGVRHDWGRKHWRVSITITGKMVYNFTRLIALMLGRLRMSVQSCESTYCEFTDAIFTSRKPHDSRRATDFLKTNGKFNETPLEELLKQRILKSDLEENALLKDERPDACKV